MKKYRVYGKYVCWKDLGEFEADSEKEAIDKAVDVEDTDISLCYHCATDNSIGEIVPVDEFQVEEVEE